MQRAEQLKKEKEEILRQQEDLARARQEIERQRAEMERKRIEELKVRPTVVSICFLLTDSILIKCIQLLQVRFRL